MAAEQQADLAEVLLLVGLLVFLVLGRRGGFPGRGLVLLDKLLDLGLAEIGLEEGEVVVHPAEAPQGLGRQRRRRAELCVIAALGLDRAARTRERDGAVAAVERVGEPGGDQRRRDPALARRDVADVLEHRQIHRALEAAHLHLGLRVSGRTRGGAVVLGPQHAAEVGARRVQLVPVVAVEVPLRLEQLAEHERAIKQAALRFVERLELGDRQVAPRAVEVLGLGEHVARLGAKLRLDVRRLGDGRGELAGLLVGGQQALRQRAALGQGAQLGPAPRVAVVGPQGRRALEVLQGLGELAPQAGRARVLGGDQREVAVDAAAEVQRLAQVVAGVARVLAHVARDGRDRRDLEGRQVGDRAALADRPRGERGEAGEVADDGVAPTLLARLLLDLGAEDVRGVFFKIVALEDEAVAWIDLPELPAAGAPEEHVHDIVRTRKQVLARAALAREAKRDLEVVTQQHPLAQLAVWSSQSGNRPGSRTRRGPGARADRGSGA
ncbi:MAG: hypothetical protein IPN16_24345 [Gemmatimonadetes bacterium]|nr:hypothetical protein [Gemmatimonadota bacterium]